MLNFYVHVHLSTHASVSFPAKCISGFNLGQNWSMDVSTMFCENLGPTYQIILKGLLSRYEFRK